MTTQDVLSKTLGNIQRIDPCANKVLMKATHTALYTFQTDKKGWEKTDVDGAFFIYQRCDRPYYSVLIANRQSLSDFIEPILENTCVQANGNYLYMKKSDGKSGHCDIKCIWFYKDDECSEVHTMIEDLVNNLKLGTVPTVEEPKQSSPVVETSSDSNNLLELLKAAQRKPNDRPPSSNKVEDKGSASQNITDMPALLQKLMVQEQQQMFSQPVPSNAMMSADELEKDLFKDLLTTAKPKLNVADMANSSSAISLANFSTRSIHGSELGDAAEIESVISTRVQAEDTAADEGSGSETSHNAPALNKDQFLAGLSHLLENDDTFVAQIHQAYVEALNRRLNLDSTN